MPADVGADFNATIQVRYTSDFFTNANETFYVCADIRYVDNRQFAAQIPCFNVTSEEFVPVHNTTNGAASTTISAMQLPIAAMVIGSMVYAVL
jgi:hypothetical protein